MKITLKRIEKLIAILLDPVYRKAFLQTGSAACVEHSDLFKHLSTPPFATIIDIGANRGQFALVARHAFPSARIHSFEPLAEPAARFRNAFAGDPLTTLTECAIGAAEDQAIIHVAGADDSSSLLPISSRQTGLYPETAEKETRPIAVRPLDAIFDPSQIQQPALLKIDVQGYEKQVLEGCTGLLQSFSYIYVECSFVELYSGQALAHEIISLLTDHGFILSGVYNLSTDDRGIAIQADFLFSRKSELS